MILTSQLSLKTWPLTIDNYLNFVRILDMYITYREFEFTICTYQEFNFDITNSGLNSKTASHTDGRQKRHTPVSPSKTYK